MPADPNPSLSDLQRWMRSVLTDPRGVASALARDRARTASWLPVIGETAEFRRAERLSVYGDGYFSRIVDCLGANFGSVRAVLGDHAFFHVAKAYLVKNPSTFKCIDDIGKTFPSFLARQGVSRRHPYLPDLAALEWAFHESFYADDVPRASATALADASLDERAAPRARVDPAVRLLKLRWPVEGLWRADGRWTRRRLQKLRPAEVRILVYRRDDKVVRAVRVPAPEFAALQKMVAGEPLDQVVRPLRAYSPARVQRLFGTWTTLGVIRGLAGASR